MKALDLGCGANKKKGALGVDVSPGPGVDVVHDLNTFPWPFADASFGWIEMANILEHLDRPLRVLEEVHRIAEPGATVRVVTPHYTSMYSYGDLTHYHHFGFMSFRCLDGRGRFRLRRKKIHFRDIYKLFGISLLANLMPRHWERYWCFIFPAIFVEVHLEVVKDSSAAAGEDATAGEGAKA